MRGRAAGRELVRLAAALTPPASSAENEPLNRQPSAEGGCPVSGRTTPRRVSRRRMLHLLAAGAGGTLLAACSQPGTPASPAGPAPPASPVAPAPTRPPQVASPAAAPSPAAAAAASPAAAQVRDVSFVVVDGTEPNSLDPAP